MTLNVKRNRSAKLLLHSLAWLSLVFFSLSAKAQTETEPTIPPVETEETVSCSNLETQKLEDCRQASTSCVEVYRYDALNQIRTCAYYAQRCFHLIEKEPLCKKSFQ